MNMQLDDELDLREVQRGELELVAVFRDPATGESLKLNLDQLNRVISGDMNEVHDANLSKESLLAGRNALMTVVP